VGFGRLDALSPGYEAARDAARRHGFEPVLRAPGGHAAAYHDGCLLVEEIGRAGDAIAGTQERFRDRGRRLAEALRDLGVDARVGQVPGEYCPGPYSVNARGAVKLAGTAQRVVRNGFLFGTVLTVTGTPALRAVLTEVYDLLDLQMDPGTVAGVADEAPGVGLEDVLAALARLGLTDHRG
jgi:lipoate-protein ligase A